MNLTLRAAWQRGALQIDVEVNFLRILTKLTNILVSGFSHPSEKNMRSSAGMIIPNIYIYIYIFFIYGNIIQMFQTTNQLYIFDHLGTVPPNHRLR